MGAYMNIEAERARLGLTREQMADKLGMSRTSYRNKINGSTDFTISELKELMALTKQSADYLLEAYDGTITD
jgi:transcriptional regulator with XRE-family HTH domain